MFLNAKDIMEIFGVSRAYAYKTIDELNNNLEEKGYRVIKGKIPRKFLFENYYISEQEVDNVRLQR